MSYVVHKRRLTIIILFFSHDNSTYCCTFYACVFLKPFLNYGEIGIYHFSGINYIHTAVQPLPPPTSRTSSSKTKSLYPLNTKSPFPPPPKPWPPPFLFKSGHFLTVSFSSFTFLNFSFISSKILDILISASDVFNICWSDLTFCCF